MRVLYWFLLLSFLLMPQAFAVSKKSLVDIQTKRSLESHAQDKFLSEDKYACLSKILFKDPLEFQLEFSGDDYLEASFARLQMHENEMDPRVLEIYDCYLKAIKSYFGHLPSAEELIDFERDKLIYYQQQELLAYLEQFVASEFEFFDLNYYQKYMFAVFFQIHGFDFENSKEFTAITLKKGEQIKIFLGTYLHNSGVGVSLARFYNDIDNLVGKGWKVLSHIHNHPFILSSTFLGGGYIVPSPQDVESSLLLIQRYPGLQPLVTNGLQTMNYKSTKYQK